MPRAIVLNPADNVATLLGAGRAGEALELEGEGSGKLVLLQDVPFGHKVCITDTAPGATILKYGQVIGRASQAIRPGEHMHVHNIESSRARGDLNKG
ncbi:UxaA family hydrolase [Cupriavidus sp. IDO]|uniref:UxaA family hydrolase n=1 Tax=Cupriavidus sp. IDO TaxID=1539142 RepID=UPI000579334C|nr:UxaA family hydrolase [Cupriavidus sp. IDO]KWR77526.1 D-galactarate dehydratase [Cupriavidus sp. IDO]